MVVVSAPGCRRSRPTGYRSAPAESSNNGPISPQFINSASAGATPPAGETRCCELVGARVAKAHGWIPAKRLFRSRPRPDSADGGRQRLDPFKIPSATRGLGPVPQQSVVGGDPGELATLQGAAFLAVQLGVRPDPQVCG